MAVKTRAHTLLLLRSLLGLAAALALAACLFAPSPEKINDLITSGQAVKAIDALTSQLAKKPDDPALNLLAAKAHLALCAQRNCTRGSAAPLAEIPGYFSTSPNPVQLSNAGPTLSPQSVVEGAIPAFTALEPQPQSLLALYRIAPTATRPQVLSAMFQPALNLARGGNYKQAGEELNQLSQVAELPAPATAFAAALSGMFTNQPEAAQSQIIGLRSLQGEIPPTAAALVPWALLAQAQATREENPSQNTLQTLPDTIQGWKLSNIIDERAKAGLTQELNTIRTTNALLEPWRQGSAQSATWLNLTLQQLSLSLNPNQPDVWGLYLPALIRAQSSAGTSGTTPLPGNLSFDDFSPASLTSSTQQQLATQLLGSAHQLAEQPSAATPLVILAGSLALTKPQQIDLDKLTQDLILKAAAQSDITATTQLAKFKPEVALNNRQVVVPLLVTNIRTNLRAENFKQAVDTAELLENTLQIDVQLEPIILQEFTDAMRRRNINASLSADKPDVLLQPEDAVAIDLGPLYSFMADYFADKPETISAQLTTLIANAHGIYGPATAMYRLSHLFPDNAMPAEKRQDWLNQAITDAVLSDDSLSGPAMATLTAQLIALHPGLSPAPLIEASLRRAPELEEARQIWLEAPPAMRTIIESVRPQFTSLMHAVDALQAHRYSAAAKALSEVTDPYWYERAKPYLSILQGRLADLTGLYVPVSGVQTLKTALIGISPQGLSGGPLTAVSLTFINRMGTLTESDPATLSSTPAAVRRLSFPAEIDFDTMRIAITPDVLASIPEGGEFSRLFGPITTLQMEKARANGTGLMQVTYRPAGGTPTQVSYLRAVASMDAPLTPNGTYLIQSPLGQAVPGTETILPTGSMLVLHTQSSLPGATSIPLTGSIFHPAKPQPILLEGTFDPNLLVGEFTFSYPLPESGKPVTAAVRCQALAGPIICGAHHTHSARLKYATLVSGMQTRESLTATAKAREEANTTLRAEQLKAAAQYQPLQPLSAEAEPILVDTPPSATPPSPTAVSATTSTTSVSNTQPTPQPSAAPQPTAPSTTAPAPAAMPSPTTSPTAGETSPTLEDYVEEEPTPPATSPSTPAAPTVTTITLPTNAPISGSIPAGVFIHKTNAKPAAQ
ncbi:MAG: hypothetical protein GC129_04345 [Proteobacteria bacterium]|nr:hypothetical protein [Pseudomonadota bacterium]